MTERTSALINGSSPAASCVAHVKPRLGLVCEAEPLSAADAAWGSAWCRRQSVLLTHTGHYLGG